ncbi:PapD-like protein, partial [Ramicandelaber brevisporus]
MPLLVLYTKTGPFDKSVHVNITLSNEHDPSSYAFKVKTTAPKRYLVRPIHGSVEPGEVFTVHVYLQGQPNTDDIVADLIASRDKFLIQSAPIGPEEKEIMSQNEAGYSQLWHHLERNKKQMIRENRMRCSFVFPPEDDDLGNGVGS